MKQTLVYHKFFNSAQLEDRGVSRIFDTLEDAQNWAAQNVGNWQFQQIDISEVPNA